MNDYGADLARIHHEGYGDLARHAGPAIVGNLRSAGIRRGLVVDLGCGSGILARHLLESGYDVLTDHTFVRAGSPYQRSHTDHRVGVYAPEAVLRELRARGFTARTRRGYGSSELGPRRVVFHARLN